MGLHELLYLSHRTGAILHLVLWGHFFHPQTPQGQLCVWQLQNTLTIKSLFLSHGVLSSTAWLKYTNFFSCFIPDIIELRLEKFPSSNRRIPGKIPLMDLGGRIPEAHATVSALVKHLPWVSFSILHASRQQCYVPTWTLSNQTKFLRANSKSCHWTGCDWSTRLTSKGKQHTHQLEQPNHAIVSQKHNKNTCNLPIHDLHTNTCSGTLSLWNVFQISAAWPAELMSISSGTWRGHCFAPQPAAYVEEHRFQPETSETHQSISHSRPNLLQPSAISQTPSSSILSCWCYKIHNLLMVQIETVYYPGDHFVGFCQETAWLPPQCSVCFASC